MTPQRSAIMTRKQIAEFIGSERGVRTFEAMQGDVGSVYDAVQGASFLTLDANQALGSERVFTPTTGELTGSDGGAGKAYTLGLADAGTAGAYGAATKTLGLTVDAKGRVTAVTPYDLNTSNVTEGSNLYFTTARARIRQQVTPVTQSSSVTLAGSDMFAGIINYTGAAGSLTMPAGADIDTAQAMAVNDSVDLSVMNRGTGTATLVASADVSVVASATVAVGTSGLFRLRKTATATYILYRIA